MLVVTDGEPTAHLRRDGEAVLRLAAACRRRSGRPSREVDQLTRYGATLNVFMLGEDPGLRRFVDAVARRNGGRVFTPDADDLGALRGQRLPAGPPRPAGCGVTVRGVTAGGAYFGW